MSSVSLKNEITEDLLICRACLATNRKLFSIQRKELLLAYKNLTGDEVSPYDNYPQYVCSYCTSLLTKFNAFRAQCHLARRCLEDASVRSVAIPNDFKQHIQLNTTDTKITSFSENHDEEDCNELNVNDIDNTDITSPNSPFNSPISPNSSPYNLKIYTDTVKIEKLDVSDINAKTNQRTLKKRSKIEKKGKYFEAKENLKDFERDYDVVITVLSQEQQIKDVLERKSGLNYLHSPYRCDLCYKGFMGADILDKHVLTQHDPSRGNVVCEICRFRYKDRRGLNQHLKSHRLKFSCKQCSYVSRTTFNAKEHFKMHGGQMHECRHCGKSYEKLSSHLTHLRIQHPSEFIWCDLCGEAFIGTFGLNAHKKRAHRHLSLPSTCSSCGTRVSTPAALKRHLSTDTCKEYTCVHCGDGFEDPLELRTHLLEKHRICEVYACEKCNKTFSRGSLYSAHYRRVHVASDDKVRKKEKPWVCEVCGKTLPNKCMLLYHQRNHTGEKPYVCTQCPKSFTMKKLLQSHLRVHSSDRPYSCRLCPKTFKGLSALRTHEKVHTGGQEKISSRNVTI